MAGISGATDTIRQTELRRGPVNPTARWPDRLEHLATLLRADALAIVTAEGDRFTTLFSRRVAENVDWAGVVGPDAFAGAERGPMAVAVPAGRWGEAASYAVVAKIDLWNGRAFLVALRPDVPFDPVEALAAKDAAGLLEMSVIEDRLLAETLRQSAEIGERVRTLEGLGEELVRAKDASGLLARAAQDVARRMGAGAASIMVVEGDRLRLRASVGLPDAALGSAQRIGEGIAGWAAAHREKIVLRGPVRDDRFTGIDADAGESVVLPLVEGGDVLGVLNVKRPDVVDGFADRGETLDALAVDLAKALRAMNVIGELHRDRESAIAFADLARAVAAHDTEAALATALALGHHAVAVRDGSGTVIASRSIEGDERCRDAAFAASGSGRPGSAESGVGFARHGAAYASEEKELAQQTADTLALLGRSFAQERPSALRVLAVEDHPVMRLGVRAMLEREGFAVAGTSATCAEAIGLLREVAPDVVLLDLRLPDASGAEAVTRVREAAPNLPIVVFSVERTPALIRATLRAGANGFVGKDAPIARLVAAIRAAAAGLVVMGPDEAVAAAGTAAQPTSEERTNAGAPDRPTETEAPHEPLTPRELELLRYMAEGYTNKEVARAMVLAEDTVKKAVQTLIAKLGAADRTHAVVIALRTHLID
ncbi:MAG TPA: response regulator [Candidatus Limnocylindria bacterium]